jgi:hypothetical protein
MQFFGHTCFQRSDCCCHQPVLAQDAMFCQFFASFDVKNKVDAILFYRLLYPTLDERGPRAPSPEKDEHGSSAQLQLQPVDF